MNARPGGQYDASAPKKANLEKGLYQLHVKNTQILYLIIFVFFLRYILNKPEV